jgi:hypothetical protein
VLTDFLLEHRWVCPTLLVLLVLLGPPVGAWLARRPRVAWAAAGVALLPLFAVTLVPVDRRLDGRCQLSWVLPTPDRVEIFANLVLFVGPVLLVGVALGRPLVAFAIGALASVAVEAVQAAITAIGRSCDTNDWLANTLGAAVGALLAALALALSSKRSPRLRDRTLRSVDQ